VVGPQQQRSRFLLIRTGRDGLLLLLLLLLL
jgi:hypothetical protein